MTRAQKAITSLGLFLIAISAVFPPWKDYSGVLGQFAFFMHPGSDVDLDVHRLLIEWIIVVAITGGLLLLTSKGKTE